MRRVFRKDRFTFAGMAIALMATGGCSSGPTAGTFVAPGGGLDEGPPEPVSFIVHGDLIRHQAFATDGQITPVDEYTATVLFASTLAPLPGNQGDPATNSGATWLTATCDYAFNFVGMQPVSIALSNCTGTDGWVMPTGFTFLSQRTMEATSAATFDVGGSIVATAVVAQGEGSFAGSPSSNTDAIGNYAVDSTVAYAPNDGTYSIEGIAFFDGMSDLACPDGVNFDCGATTYNIVMKGTVTDQETFSAPGYYRTDGVGVGTLGAGRLVSDTSYRIYQVDVTLDEEAPMDSVSFTVGLRTGVPQSQIYGFVVYGSNTSNYEYSTTGLINLATDNTATITYSASLAPMSGSYDPGMMGTPATNTGAAWQVLSGCTWTTSSLGDIDLVCPNTTNWLLPTRLNLVGDGRFMVTSAADQYMQANTAWGEATAQGTGPFSNGNVWSRTYTTDSTVLYAPYDGSYAITGIALPGSSETTSCPDGTFGCTALLPYIGAPERPPFLGVTESIVMNLDGTGSLYALAGAGPVYGVHHVVLTRDGEILYGIGVTGPEGEEILPSDSVDYFIGRTTVPPPVLGTFAFYLGEASGGMGNTPYATVGTFTLDLTGTATFKYSASMAPGAWGSGLGSATNSGDSWLSATCDWTQTSVGTLEFSGCTDGTMTPIPWAIPATLIPFTDQIDGPYRGNQWTIAQVSIGGASPQSIAHGTGAAQLQDVIPTANAYFAGNYRGDVRTLYNPTTPTWAYGDLLADGLTSSTCPDTAMAGCGSFTVDSIPTPPSGAYRVDGDGLASGFGVNWVVLHGGGDLWGISVDSSSLSYTSSDVQYFRMTYHP